MRRARHLYLVAVTGASSNEQRQPEYRMETASARLHADGGVRAPIDHNESYVISSQAPYDPRWGKPLTTTDTNGKQIERRQTKARHF